jgi:hypothetical protein
VPGALLSTVLRAVTVSAKNEIPPLPAAIACPPALPAVAGVPFDPPVPPCPPAPLVPAAPVNPVTVLLLVIINAVPPGHPVPVLNAGLGDVPEIAPVIKQYTSLGYGTDPVVAKRLKLLDEPVLTSLMGRLINLSILLP